MSGYVLFKGPSRIDGSPIVVVATTSSSNEKTGNMVQTWILRRDVPPTYAVASGLDHGICGVCVHRGNGDGTGRSFYIKYWQAPNAIWHTYRFHGYQRPKRLRGLFAGRTVRLGAYEDPAAVPIHVWQQILDGAAG